MQWTSLSWNSNRPCILLKWPSITVLVDCAIDLSSLSFFLPCTYTSSLHSKLPSHASHSCIRLIQEYAFVEGQPEVHPTPLDLVSMDSVDAIFISNSNSITALPFYTEGTGFRGIVYATNPTVELGRLMIEELLEYFDRVVVDPAGDDWKDLSAEYVNWPIRSPREWRSFYSREEAKAALSRVVTVAFNETTVIENYLRVTACCSGYAIGSCNWVFATDEEKVAYVTASSNFSSYVLPADWKPLQNADALFLTSLALTKVDNNVINLMRALNETVKNGGVVLLPVTSVGTVYELLETISLQLDSLDAMIYFISPVAESSLAYANAFAEWLCDSRRNAIYQPEEPFVFQKLVKGGRLKIYSEMHSSFSREVRQPSVIFAGHPSLRIGDMPHLMQSFGGSSKNLVIFTDAEYSTSSGLFTPYDDFPIRKLFFPIEARIDVGSAHAQILSLVEPKALIMNELYSRTDPPLSFRGDTRLFRYGDSNNVGGKVKRRKVKVNQELIRAFGEKPRRPRVAMPALIQGALRAYDNSLELHTVESSANARVHLSTVGKITAKDLQSSLERKNLSVAVNVEDRTGDSILSIKNMRATIRVSQDGLRTNVRAPREHRIILLNLISILLKSV